MIAISLTLIVLSLPQKNVGSMCPPSRIGTFGGGDLTVRLVASEADSFQCDLKLLFERTSHDNVRLVSRFDVGPSFGLPATLMILPMLGNGRSQVFISARFGAVRSFLLDFDGQRVKMIYSRTEGRVDAMPIYQANGKAMILEIWRPREYTGEFKKLGNVVRSGPWKGMVLRYVPIT